MKILGWQCVGLIAIIVWTAVISGLMFGVLRLFGILRVCDEAQEKGEMVAFNNKLHQQQILQYHVPYVVYEMI